MAVSLRSQDGKRITNSPNTAAKNSGAISERSFSEKNCKEFEVIIIYSGIISSKDSENLELSLCVRVKAGKPYWMPMIFGPLDGTASHTEMLP